MLRDSDLEEDQRFHREINASGNQLVPSGKKKDSEEEPDDILIFTSADAAEMDMSEADLLACVLNAPRRTRHDVDYEDDEELADDEVDGFRPGEIDIIEDDSIPEILDLGLNREAGKRTIRKPERLSKENGKESEALP